jgi:sugar lactone lactonase YvrE
MRGRESQRERVVHIEGLSFPESLRWHDGALWFTDLSTQRVMRAGGDGHVQTVAELPDIPSALGWTPDGRLLIVQAISRQLLRMDDSTLAVVADMSAHVTYRCNDMIVDRRGRVYVGNMGFDLGDPEAVPQPGSILLVTPNGDVRIVADELAFPNGMAITPDGQTLIVAESYAARLTAFDITPDGSLVHPRTWASFAPSTTAGAEEVTPDGIALDAEGALWVASPGTRDVLRVREDDEITERIPLGAIPLTCVLGGREGRTLFIATTESLDPSEAGAIGRIEAVEVAVPGVGLP